MDQEQLRGILLFLQTAENLKNTLRCAYTSEGKQESAAEHSWRLCLMAMAFGDFCGEIDRKKLLQLAVLHDLGEALTGDVSALTRPEAGQKTENERQAMRRICDPLPEKVKSEFLSLWEEYEAATSLEAKIVRGLDKLETILQHNQGKNPPDFDYSFNLTYGKEFMEWSPLLRQIRRELDLATAAHLEKE